MDNARRRSLEVSTLSKEDKLVNVDNVEISRSGLTVSENLERESSEDESKEEMTAEETQLDKRRKISGRSLAESYPEDEIKCSIKESDLNKL